MLFRLFNQKISFIQGNKIKNGCQRFGIDFFNSEKLLNMNILIYTSYIINIKININFKIIIFNYIFILT